MNKTNTKTGICMSTDSYAIDDADAIRLLSSSMSCSGYVAQKQFRDA